MLFLGYLDGHELPESVEGPWREVVTLRPGLVFVDSPHSRSVVYHALKDHLPPGCPLLVAELHEVPKFKGMAAGTTRWAKEHLAEP